MTGKNRIEEHGQLIFARVQCGPFALKKTGKQLNSRVGLGEGLSIICNMMDSYT